MTHAWMTRQEAADHLRLSVDTIDRYARDGRLTKYVVAGSRATRYKRAELDALLTPEASGCDHEEWTEEPVSKEVSQWSCANCGCPLEKVESVDVLTLICGHEIDLTEPLHEIESELRVHFPEEGDGCSLEGEPHDDEPIEPCDHVLEVFCTTDCKTVSV